MYYIEKILGYDSNMKALYAIRDTYDKSLETCNEDVVRQVLKSGTKILNCKLSSRGTISVDKYKHGIFNTDFSQLYYKRFAIYSVDDDTIGLLDLSSLTVSKYSKTVVEIMSVHTDIDGIQRRDNKVIFTLSDKRKLAISNENSILDKKYLNLDKAKLVRNLQDVLDNLFTKYNRNYYIDMDCRELRRRNWGTLKSVILSEKPAYFAVNCDYSSDEIIVILFGVDTNGYYIAKMLMERFKYINHYDYAYYDSSLHGNAFREPSHEYPIFKEMLKASMS